MCFFEDKTAEFKSSLATNDTNLDRGLLSKLDHIVRPLTDDRSIAFSYLIWLSPKPDDKDNRLMSVYLSADDLEKGKKQIDDITRDCSDKIDAVVKNKSDEIMLD